jgi:mono/diheme cytochrome c family protein
MLSNKNQTAARCQSPTPATEESVMVKPFQVPFAVALLALAPLALSGAPPQAPAKGSAASSAKPAGDPLAKAKQVYKIDCAMCHGDNGDGKTDLSKDLSLSLMDWTDPKSLSSRMDPELFNVIRNGKDKMPPEDKGRATDDEVHGLIVYIRSMAKAQASAPAAPAEPAAAAATTTTPAATPAPNR